MSSTNPNINPSAEKCLLLGNHGLIVQGFLGIITIGVALIKRNMENPKRNWIIWFMDILKQFLGLLFVHFFNVIAAGKFVEIAETGDECSWYFITYICDVLFTTAGAFLIMKKLDQCFAAKGYPVGQTNQNLVTGNYFKGYKISLKYWVEQAGIWLLVLLSVDWVHTDQNYSLSLAASFAWGSWPLQRLGSQHL